MVQILEKGEYVPYYDMWPDRIDVFTLLASIALLVVSILMVYWLGTLCYRTFGPPSKMREIPPSPTSVRVKKEMDYLGEEEESESLPLDWVIERPEHLRSERLSSGHTKAQPILSDRTLSISEAGRATPKRSRRSSGHEPRSPPVLNVIWEPTQGIYAAEGPDEKESHIADHRQLISSTPIILKKPARSGRGHIDEPVIVNLYYEPSTPGEYIQVSAPASATPKAVPGETTNTTAVVSNDAAPSVSVTTTTTRTRVSEPRPGYTKKVTQTFTTTKEVRRTPVHAQDKPEVKSPPMLTAKEMLKEVGEKPAASSTSERGQKEVRESNMSTARENEVNKPSPGQNKQVIPILSPAPTQVETPRTKTTRGSIETVKTTLIREYVADQPPPDILGGQPAIHTSGNPPAKPTSESSVPK
ncbi:hypothetical protein Aduo_004144 [Ancylostoma duodenale]